MRFRILTRGTALAAVLCSASVCGHGVLEGLPMAASIAWADDAIVDTTVESTEATDAASNLVEMLGDGDYSRRETAATKLRNLGMEAKSALMAALKHPDLEIRMRAHQILVRTLQDDFDQRMTQFILDVDDQKDHGLPGWKEFRGLMGPELKTRKLYVEMVRTEPELLEMLESRPEKLTETLSQRVRNLQSASFNNFNFNAGGRSKIEPASVATILFLSLDDRVRSDRVLYSSTYSVLNQPLVRQAIRGGANSKQLKQLLHRWVIRENSPYPYYALLLALNYDLQEAGLELGRRELGGKSQSSTSMQYAAIAVGRFGGKKDVKALEAHLKNKTLCHTWSNPQLKKEPIRIEVRDVVLAMLVHLTKQDFQAYGFNLLQENATTLFHLHTFGFLEDKERDAALKKWEDWRAQNKDG